MRIPVARGSSADEWSPQLHQTEDKKVLMDLGWRYRFTPERHGRRGARSSAIGRCEDREILKRQPTGLTNFDPSRKYPGRDDLTPAVVLRSEDVHCDRLQLSGRTDSPWSRSMVRGYQCSKASTMSRKNLATRASPTDIAVRARSPLSLAKYPWYDISRGTTERVEPEGRTPWGAALSIRNSTRRQTKRMRANETTAWTRYGGTSGGGFWLAARRNTPLHQTWTTPAACRARSRWWREN